MTRYGLIRAALEALAVSGAPKWMPRPAGFSGFVVTLHHVTPGRRPAFDPNGILTASPEFLDAFIRCFKAAGWRFVTIDKLATAPKRPADARRIAVTLDDGFRDNAEHALPVFRRHAVPFTLYVCPGFSDRTAELWWEALERIIAGTDALPRPGHVPAADLPARTPAEKAHAFALWRAWLTTDADETQQRTAIRALASAHGLDLAELARELVMDWDEIRAIAAEPLCTIGAHTLTHPALARLPADEALREMRESADRIEVEIGVRPRTIAFPYGYLAAAGPREAQLAGEAGFSASFTTRPGYVTASGHRQGLPRVSLNGLYQQPRYLEVLLTPGLWNLRDRVRGER